MSFIVLAPTFRLVMHFELIPVNGVRQGVQLHSSARGRPAVPGPFA